MRVHNFPLTIGASEEKCFVTTLVNVPVRTHDSGLQLYVYNGPGEIALNVSFDVREDQIEIGQRVPLRFDMVFDKVC